MRNGALCCGLAVLVALSAFAAAAVEKTQAHDPLLLNVGFTGWSYDTGWMGAMGTGGNVGAYIRLWAGVGGTVLNFSASGAGRFRHPTTPDTGLLWFEGSTGSASEDIGIEFHGQYKIVVFGLEYTGNLPYVPSADLRLSDSESFTPYLPTANIVLDDEIQNQQLYVYPIGVANVFSANIGVGVTAGDHIEIDPKSLNTDKGVFTTDGQQISVPAAGASVTVSNIYETIGITPSMTILPTAIVGITVGPFTYNINIPTYEFSVPLASLIQPEYPTTPTRSITFTLPPVVRAFSINSGASLTMGRVVSLTNTSSNAPTQYMASEVSTFDGAVWLPYAAQAQFTLQPVDGLRTVYFRTQNANGASETLSDSIQMDRTLPTVNSLITSDSTPPLSGTVLYPTATVSVSVGGQTRAAVNNGSGQWSLADNLLTSIAQGVYDVVVTVTDELGNTLTDSSTNELTIDTSPPTLTVNSLRTGNATPQLSGTVAENMTLISVNVTVAGQVYPATFADGAWTINVTTPLAAGDYTIQAVGTDSAGNVGSATGTLTIDFSAIDISVDRLISKITSPRLTGTVGEPSASISVRIIGAGLLSSATNNHDGTWYADSAPYTLAEGTYEVRATATASGRTGTDGTTKELTIDLTPPEVRVTPLTTNDTTPHLTGDIIDATETGVNVTVDGHVYAATVSGSKWSVDITAPLAQGTYEVLATATDAAGNTSNDPSSDELLIDTTVPAVTVDTLTTNSRSPALSGTVDDPTATVRVTIGTQTLVATYVGSNRWTLAAGLLTALAEGAHEVEMTATDPAGNVGYDSTHYEVLVDTVAPTATIVTLSPSPTGANAVAFRVTFSETVSPALTQVTLAGSLATSASAVIGGSGLVYDITVTPANPDANGTIGIAVASGTYRDVANNACSGAGSTLCTVQNWCGFDTEPESRRLYVGDSYTLSAVPDCGIGGDLAYQWKWDHTAAKSIEDGPTTSSWVLSSVTPDMRGDYWCVVRYDTDEHATGHATVDVQDHLVIAIQPQGGTEDLGGSHEFTVATDGGYAPLRYVWKQNGTAIPSATTPSLVLSQLVLENSGTYTVEVSDDNLDTQVSLPAILQVKSTLPLLSTRYAIGLAAGCFLMGSWMLLRTRGRRDHRH